MVVHRAKDKKQVRGGAYGAGLRIIRRGAYGGAQGKTGKGRGLWDVYCLASVLPLMGSDMQFVPLMGSDMQFVPLMGSDMQG
jgi:hypothetical protein